MRITKITCQGFKTYCDKTSVTDIDNRINCVVGLNGSGKSSLFQAVVFVLSPAIGGACSSGTFLHEGGRGKSNDGFVEIEISLSSIDLVDVTKRLTLRRTLAGHNRNDGFLVNGKAVQRSEYITLLQTNHLAGNNVSSCRKPQPYALPYYVVEQGRIASTASISDEDRFGLLREASGLDVFQEKRDECLSILAETDSKRIRVSELMKQLINRCKRLGEECSEMHEYSELRRDRDRAEFMIGKLEMEYFANIKEKLVIEVQNGGRRLSELEDQVADLEEQEKRLGDVAVDARLAELEECQSKLLLQKSSKKSETVDQCSLIERSQAQLLQVDALLVSLEEKKRSVTASIEVDKVEIGNARINLNKQQCAKLELANQLQQLETRDEDLSVRERELSLTLSSARRRVGLVMNEINEKESELARLQTVHIPEKQAEMRVRQGEFDSFQATFEAEAQAHANLAQEARGMHANIFAKKQKLFEISRESDKLEREFKEVSGSVLRSSNWNTRDLVSRSDIKGVRGFLGDYVVIPSVLRVAVESSARNILFQVMIDSDEVADQVASKLAGGKGKVTLSPINKLVMSDFTNDLERRLSQSGLNAQLHSSVITPREDAESWVKDAICKFFSKTVVVDNIDTGVQVAKQFKIDAVTIEGDLVSKDLVVKGGGAMKSHQTAGGVVRNWQVSLELKQKIATLKMESKKFEAEAAALEQSVKRVESQLHGIPHSSESSKKQEEIRSQLAAVRKELSSLLDRKNDIERFELVNLREVDLANSQNEVARLESELVRVVDLIAKGTSSTKTLSESERRAMIDCTCKEMKSVDAKILSLERTIETVSKRMHADRAELEHFIANRIDHLTEVQTERRAELDHARTKKERLETELQAIELGELKSVEFEICQRRSLPDSSSNVANTRSELEAEKTRIHAEISNIVAGMKVNESRIFQVEADLVECSKHLPLAPVGNAHDMELDPDSLRALRSRIVEINKQLNSNKFAYINKKSLEQFESLDAERRDLELRQRELDHAHISLVGFLEELRVKENQIVQAAFEKVNKSFTRLFAKLTGSSSPGQSSELRFAQDKISVHVSFPSGGDAKPQTAKRLHELSGGQRTLVALCYLLALSQASGIATSESDSVGCFYVLDEVDAALDANYRAALAETLLEESLRGTQFILTSFRPELCSVANKHLRVSMVAGSSVVESVDIATAMNLVNGDSGKTIQDEISVRE